MLEDSTIDRVDFRDKVVLLISPKQLPSIDSPNIVCLDSTARVIWRSQVGPTRANWPAIHIFRNSKDGLSFFDREGVVFDVDLETGIASPGNLSFWEVKEYPGVPRLDGLVPLFGQGYDQAPNVVFSISSTDALGVFYDLSEDRMLKYMSKFKIVRKSRPAEILFDALDSRFYTMPWFISLDSDERYLTLVRDAYRPPVSMRPVMAVDLETFAFGFFPEIKAYNCLLEPRSRGRFKPVQARSYGERIVDDKYKDLILDASSVKMHPASETPRLMELMFSDIDSWD